MRRASLITILMFLTVSLMVLSTLSNILTGYPERPRVFQGGKQETTEYKESSVLLFEVSPAGPQLFWRTLSADYYTGFNWFRTTEEKAQEEFPQVQNAYATEVFTVEIHTKLPEVYLPLPSSNSTLTDVSFESSDNLTLYADTIGSTYRILRIGQAMKAPLAYKVLWRDIELDDRFISLSNISEEILDTYLQLPDIPVEIQKLADDLENPSYSILDQILADVQFLRTNFVYDESPPKFLIDNFVYDVNSSRYPYGRVTQGSDVLSYLKLKKGICVDAATMLTVILRIQKIPARISIGYKPERVESGKLSYYTSGAHALTEVYLPPYGWVQFDATPPLEETPLVKVSPFKKEASPGSTIFFQLSITNRYNLTDIFWLSAHTKQEWNIRTAPEELEIAALQTAYALLEVTIPQNAEIGEKDVVTLSVISLGRGEVSFSILVIIQVGNVFHISTSTSIKYVDTPAVRGNTFWTNGTVLTSSNEQVDNMSVFVFLTRSRTAEGVVVGKGYSEQGHFQIKSKVPSYLEIGDYKVILLSLGTTRHAPSSSNSTIRVLAKTRITLGPEEEFLLGYGVIYGYLSWDNGTDFANALVSIKISSSTTPSEVSHLQKLTLKDGSFRIEATFENPGIYEVNAMFSGNEYILSSNATRVVKLERGLPKIEIIGEDIAIRGEIFSISGTIRFEDIGVWGEPLTLSFDNQLLTTLETRVNGSFAWAFLVDSEEQLGPHTFTVTLKKGNESALHKVLVKSKTTLTTKVSNVAGGMFVLFSTSLSDDHDLPIHGAEILVDNYGLSWKTDVNGNLTFFLDTIKFWPENLVLTARFEGSELYLPIRTEKTVAIESVISLPFLLPMVSPTLLILAFAYVRHHLGRRRQILQQVTKMEVVKERTMNEEIIVQPQKTQPLNFVFSDIDTQFPNVWGVGDKLRIELVLDESVLKKKLDKKVEVFIDEENVASVQLSQQGRAELSHMFLKKGEPRLRAIMSRTFESQPLSGEITIRIVEYREEIIRLYKEFLEKLADYNIHAGNEMTAREIENLILKTSDFNSEALSRVVTCFEKAEYSNHLATRKDYETMYMALKELNISVE